MALSQDQLIAIRQEVGDNEPTDAELNVIYARLGDVDELVLEVLNRRLATWESEPEQFAIPGEYSQTREEVLEGLRSRVGRLGGPIGAVAIVKPLHRIGR